MGIRETRTLETHRAADVGEPHGLGLVHQVGGDVQNLEDARDGHHRLLYLSEVSCQPLHGLEEALKVQGEGHEDADLDRPVQHHAPAEEHHERQADGVDRLDGREQSLGEPGGLEVGVQVLLIGLSKLTDVGLLPAEALWA